MKMEEQDGVLYHLDGHNEASGKPTFPHRADMCSVNYCGRKYWNPAKRLEVIGYIVDQRTRLLDEPEADYHLKDAAYVLEAVDAILAGDTDQTSAVIRQFLATHPSEP